MQIHVQLLLPTPFSFDSAFMIYDLSLCKLVDVKTLRIHFHRHLAPSLKQYTSQ